jgi:2-polyprenyl-6-methoxyphenol hydroxylase-like FAD-dependent oxidoreductase
MASGEKVLVIGAGAAGTTAAAFLAEGGVSVDLIEAKPDVTALGSGITLQGNALRVLKQVGVWEQVAASGYSYDSLGLRAPDPAGTLLVELPDVRTGGPDLPATCGVSRPELARFLIDRARELGTSLRFGIEATALADDGQGVDVDFSDGSSARYDLVIAADGIHSATRAMVGIDVEPSGIGMGIWRAFTPRPASVTRSDLYYGGPSYIAGYTPTGEDSLYCFIVEPYEDRSALSPEEGLAVMREKSLAYHGPWDEIREVLDDPFTVNYTMFSTHVLPAPWNRGRVVLVGDAAHSCPPTLAQGAAMAFEDAAVLAELVLAAQAVDDDLWSAFMERRFERAKTVVDGSNQLAQWLIDHVQGDVPALMGRITAMLAVPA